MKRAGVNRNRLWLNDNRRAINRGMICSVEAIHWMESSLYGRIIKWVNIWSTDYYTSMPIVMARSDLLLRFLLLWFLPFLFSKPSRFLYRSSKTLG